MWNSSNVCNMPINLKTPPTAVISQLLEIPSDFSCGPAMKKLNERQKAFVTAMLDFGGRNNTRAARAAGYDGADEVVRVTAHRLAHDPKIQEAIKEEGEKRLNAGTIMAVNILLEICDDATTEKKDRLKAAEMILNRVGLHAKSEHKVAVTHKDETSKEMIAEIKLLSERLGIDPQKLLGNQAIVEAEFVEVEEFDENSLDDLL